MTSTTSTTKTATTRRKPIARIDEPYAHGSKWVLCTVHFGWHHERETCENPRDDSNAQLPETATTHRFIDESPINGLCDECGSSVQFHEAQPPEPDAGLRDDVLITDHSFVPQDDYNVRLCGIPDCGYSKSQHQTTATNDAMYQCDACDKYISEENPRGGIRGGGEGAFCPECCGKSSAPSQPSRVAAGEQDLALPWRRSKDGCDVEDANGCGVFTTYADERIEAKADYALNAVNSHKSLVAALSDALESLRRLPDTDGAFRQTCIKQAEKALAQAREGA